MVDMVDHYFAEGVATPFELANREMDRRQIEHVITARFGTNPGGLMGGLDHDARAIARYVEQAWDDAIWAA